MDAAGARTAAASGRAARAARAAAQHGGHGGRRARPSAGAAQARGRRVDGAASAALLRRAAARRAIRCETATMWRRLSGRAASEGAHSGEAGEVGRHAAGGAAAVAAPERRSVLLVDLEADELSQRGELVDADLGRSRMQRREVVGVLDHVRHACGRDQHPRGRRHERRRHMDTRSPPSRASAAGWQDPSSAESCFGCNHSAESCFALRQLSSGWPHEPTQGESP